MNNRSRVIRVSPGERVLIVGKRRRRHHRHHFVRPFNRCGCRFGFGFY